MIPLPAEGPLVQPHMVAGQLDWAESAAAFLEETPVARALRLKVVVLRRSRTAGQRPHALGDQPCPAQGATGLDKAAYPLTPVTERIGSGGHAEWAVSPWTDPDAYRLAFNLPERIESWISENEERRVRRASDIKSDFLSEITIYRRHSDNMRIYQLRYEPSELHRSTS